MAIPGRTEFHDIIGELPSFGVAAHTTALMIIDMQYSDAHRHYGIGRKLEEHGLAHLGAYRFDRIEQTILPNIRRLLDTSRAAGLQVVHVRVACQIPDGSDMSWRYRQLGIRCPIGSRDAEILDELRPQPGELVINKSSSGVFNSTNADQILRNMGIDTLIMVGVATNGCVETSARGAGDLGFKVLLVDDGCAAWTQAAHDATMRNLHRNFAWVVTCDEVVAQIAALSERVGLR